MTFAAPTLFDGAMCLPDTTDRTCVAGPALSTDPAFFATVADLNADGVADVVATNDIGTWLELSGSGGFTRVPIGDLGGVPWVADVDGDGVLDVVTTQSPIGMQPPGITVAVAKGLGGGVFAPFISLVVSADVTATDTIALADVDGDHIADLVVGVERVAPGPTFVSSPPTLALRVYRGSPGGLVTTPVESPLSGADTACKVGGTLTWDWVTATGDFDGDGSADVALATCSGVAVALANRGQATFTGTSATGFVTKLFSLVGSLVASDVDGDGHVDLLASRGDASVGFWRGMGDGTFAPVVALAPLPDPPWQVFVADVNGDGLPDVVAQGGSLSGGSDSTVEVLLGKKPSGIGDVPHVFAPLATEGSTPQLLAVAVAPPGGKGTFVLKGPNNELHLVPGACQ
jgi:hypothetical protein